MKRGGRGERLGVAVLGSDATGEIHATAWRMLGSCDVQGFYSPDGSEIQRAERKGRTNEYRSLGELLGDGGVDVLDICTPSSTRAAVSISAMKAGKHVIVEEPMALSLRDADRMIDASGRYDRVLMVGNVLRFFHPYMRARRLVGDGALGELVTSRIAIEGPIPHDARGRAWGAAGRHWDALDLTVRDVAFLLECYDRPVIRVYGKTVPPARASGGGDEDPHMVMVNLAFEGGGIAFVESSMRVAHGRSSRAPPSREFALTGTKGMVRFDTGTPSSITVQNDRGAPRLSTALVSGGELGGPLPPLDSYREELRYFVGKVGESGPVPDTLASRAALEVCLAACASAREGAPVELP